jgi:glutathione peroxidase
MRFVFLFFLMSCGAAKKEVIAEPLGKMVPSQEWTTALDLVSIDGEPFDSSVLGGQVVLVVNVASKCGFTKQYDGLQELWTEYRDQGLVVLGVPCNQFAGQEPGEPEEIVSFCRMNFGVDFPLLEKQNVRGKDKSPLYTHLVDSEEVGGAEVAWNFEKFLVSPDGTVLGRYRSKVTPEDPNLIADIEAALRNIQR